MKVAESTVKTFTDANVAEAMQWVGFPVVERPVTVDGQVVPGKKAIVREDTGRILSVVSRSYALYRNSEVFEAPINAILGGGFRVHRASLREGGAQTLVELVGNEKYQVPGAHGNETYVKRLVLSNSYDQSSSVQVKFGSFRLICTNGAGIWAESCFFRFVHKGQGRGVDFLNIEGKVTHALSQFSHEWDAYMGGLKRLNSVELTKETLVLAQQKLMFSTQRAKNVMDRLESNTKAGESKPTLLALYNAFTEEMRDREIRHQTVSTEYMAQTHDIMEKLLEVAT